MKARVKATGKLLEKVIPIMSVDSKVVMFHEYGTEGEYYYYEDLDFSNTIDWEQVRVQATIAAMQAQLSSYQTMVALAKKAKDLGLVVERVVAICSVDCADALIAELQKRK